MPRIRPGLRHFDPQFMDSLKGCTMSGLSSDEQMEVARRASLGDVEARNRLVLHYMPLIASETALAVKRYKNINFEDAVNSCAADLIEKFATFNPDKTDRAQGMGRYRAYAKKCITGHLYVMAATDRVIPIGHSAFWAAVKGRKKEGYHGKISNEAIDCVRNAQRTTEFSAMNKGKMERKFEPEYVPQVEVEECDPEVRERVEKLLYFLSPSVAKHIRVVFGIGDEPVPEDPVVYERSRKYVYDSLYKLRKQFASNTA